MKYTIPIFCFLLLLSCSKEEPNLPPGLFTIKIPIISNERALINWTEAIDPEGEIVTYSFFIDAIGHTTRVNDRLEGGSRTIMGLDPSTTYNGFIEASDENTGVRKVNFCFTTPLSGTLEGEFNDC
ncbi:MAG: hypothetical protein OEW75_11490 [Cyclobacteriaceae bacterium]|nr:hypothetical protein [Cyclobacteriaceae bacterium]